MVLSLEEEEEWPQEEDECIDSSYDSEGFLEVAGDGAYPRGQGDLTRRRSQSSAEMGTVGLVQNRVHHGLSAGEK